MYLLFSLYVQQDMDDLYKRIDVQIPFHPYHILNRLILRKLSYEIHLKYNKLYDVQL